MKVQWKHVKKCQKRLLATFRPLSILFLLLTGDSALFPAILKQKNIVSFFQTRKVLFSHNSQSKSLPLMTKAVSE